MSESIHRTLQEAGERQGSIERGDRVAALAAAIIAVLAALGTLFSHHASISALTAKSHAILTQARASARRSSWETQQIRYELYQALIAIDIARTPEAKQYLIKSSARYEQNANAYNNEAERLEKDSLDYDAISSVAMRAYETLEWATALFAMAIVLVSISTLSRTRVLLVIGCAISAFGLVLLVLGLTQGH